MSKSPFNAMWTALSFCAQASLALIIMCGCTKSSRPQSVSAPKTNHATTTSASNLTIGFVGDSITFGYLCDSGCVNAAASEQIALQNAGESVTINDQGVIGTTTQDWQPDGSYLPNAIAAFEAAGVDTVSIMLGTNDSKVAVNTSPAQYLINMQAIVSALLAPSTGIKRVIVNAPLYVVPGAFGEWAADGSANQTILAYTASLNQLKNVLMGDSMAFAYFQANQNLLADGVHPTAAGYLWLGNAWAAALNALLEPSASARSR